MTIDERVTKGAALLDQRIPGWREMIDRDALDIDSCVWCILGQLYGDFPDGVRLLGIFDERFELGFVCHPGPEVNLLEESWLRELSR